MRREIFWDTLLAALLAVLLIFPVFAILSKEDPGHLLLLSTTIRLFYCVALGMAVLL